MPVPVEKPELAALDRPFSTLRPYDVAASALDRDVPCITCGYNLRGLRPGGRCPECDDDINQSLASEVMWLVGPAWLRVQALGLLSMMAANVAAACLVSKWKSASIAFVAVAWCASVVLLWLPDRMQAHLCASSIRTSLMLPMAAANLAAAIFVLISPTRVAATECWFVAGAISSVIAIFAGATLAGRLPEPAMARVMRVFGVITAASLLPWLPLKWTFPTLPGDLLVAAGCVVVIGIVFLYLCMLLFLVLAAELLYLAHLAPRARADMHPTAPRANATLVNLEEAETRRD